ncbi:MAG: MurR/RpiR family transcriptional regulator [Cardiobacteriaceae bacterium]|nr:MurR/RpiR family transcriptional regulator [Cardiobacteriaceae bacterium]
MKVIERIQETAESLTPAEKRLVEVICSDPQAAALGTAAGIARAVEVHEATVSRLVRKLGFDSYAGFRHAMQSEFIPTQEPAVRLDNALAREGNASWLHMLVEQERAALRHVEDVADAAQIEAVAQELMCAKRLFFFARGNAEVLALLMDKRFRRFGKDSRQLSGERRELAEQALGIGVGDVVVAFAFRRQPAVYAPLLETVREAGARMVAIAGAVGPLLSPAPDVLISVPRSGHRDAFQTLTVPMAICNAIILAAAGQDKRRALPPLERLGTLIRRFES